VPEGSSSGQAGCAALEQDDALRMSPLSAGQPRRGQQGRASFQGRGVHMTGWTTYTVHVDGRRVIPVSHDAIGTT
jgi:hypothetical protein